jgi:ATP-binding cassette, subfamily F, member 3
MLTVSHLKKSFNTQFLFENVTFTLNPGEHAGLIGVNGCGKTTLLRILAGREDADSGQATHDPDLRIGYLPQGFEPDPGATFGDIIGRVTGDAQALEDELTQIAAALAQTPGDSRLSNQYDQLIRSIEANASGQTAAILSGLGLDCVDPNLPAGLLSGGQKTRLSLALVLLGEPQVLLLDEPTNHLDIAMLEWLESWLNQSPCGVLIVSHDRTFLDHTVTRILEMDKGQIKEYHGNYSDYLEIKQNEIEKQWSAFKDQQEEVRRMEQDIARVKAQAAFTERQASSVRIGGRDFKMKGYKSYQQGIAKKVAKKANSREKKLERYLDDDQRVEKPQRSWVMQMEFHETPHLGRSVLEMDQLAVGYDPAAPLLEDLRLQVRVGQRIALTGPNGCGKTTLLRTITGQISALGGEVHLGSSVRLGLMAQDQSSLDPNKTVVESVLDHFPNPTEARSFLAKFLFTGDEPLKPVSLLSFGQRARLMLALLVAEDCNCLLLDEPINHLDIPSRTQFEGALEQFPGAILAIVHDRYFIERFADEIWVVAHGRVEIH